MKDHRRAGTEVESGKGVKVRLRVFHHITEEEKNYDDVEMGQARNLMEINLVDLPNIKYILGRTKF